MAKPLLVGLSILHKCMNQHQSNETLQLSIEICEYFEKNLSVAEQDLAVNDAFLSADSLLVSLTKSLSQRKVHKNANIKILELILSLIDKYKPKIRQYAKRIIETMVLFYLSSTVSAKEKENAISIMQVLVKEDLCKDVGMTELVYHLLKIRNEKKPTARVLQLTFELLGLIAQEYPQSLLDDDEQQIRDLFFQTLEPTLLNQQEYSFLSLCGALNGFTYFLTNFAPCPSTQPMICERIYKCAFKLSDPGDIKDKTAFRAALHLIEKHAPIFSEQLYRDHQYWHKTLLQWLSLPNWTDRKSAIATLYPFHEELSRQVDSRGNEAILKFYINFFKSTLQSKDSRPYEIRIAINGFGVFSKACKYLLPTSLGDLLNVVMLRTEYTSIDNSKNKDILEHYPAFVQALSKIMEHTAELSAIQISSLQNIIIELMKNFYLLSKAHHEMAVTSLLKTFENLSKLGTVLDDVLEKVMMQGVIWTCSHENKLTANTNWETQKDWKEHITYENFIKLWLGLLAYDEEQFEIKERIYSHFMNTLFAVIDKLELGTKKRVFKDSNGQDQELYFCNPNLDLVPIKPNDFLIFFNIVDFYKDVLMQQSDKSHINFFSKFINQFIKKMIDKAYDHPLVSGFLKCLEVAFWISNKLVAYEPMNSQIEEQTLVTIRSFIKTVIPKCLQTSGELQISSLRLIFSLPVFLLIELSNAIVSVFRIGFEIGRSVNFMASITLTALERLTLALKEKDIAELSTLLEAVLPCLNTYLQSNDLQSESKINVKIVEFRRNKSAKKIYKADDVDSELLKLQKRILLYLGTLEPFNCIQMIENDQEEQVLTKLTVEQNIRVKLYYPQLTPTIFLDTLVPRICYLATSSSNRKTKIAACELTHAIVLYLIGTGHYQGDLWRKLCADILILASDGDDAVKQMFEPMLMQMIHYMTQRSQILHPGVEIFCEQLMEGISHKSSSAVRDLSARCLREFVKWNIKELTNNLTAEIGALPILKKLKLYSFDSDNNKRRGAALAFNNLYRIIREDNKLISEHWLDILHTFSINFIMCEEIGGDIEATYDQISTCMDHIVRVIFERKDIFNRNDENRITPTDFQGNTLKDAMIWLFKQCGAKQKFYRRKCQQMFIKLTPCVDGVNSIMEFLSKTQTLETVLEVMEGPLGGAGVAGRPDLRHIKSGDFSSSLNLWLQQLLRSLDCHLWIMGDGLYKDTRFYEKSMLPSAVTVFINEICLLPLSSIFRNLETESEATSSQQMLYINEDPKITSMKREIIVRIIDYFIKIVPTSVFPESFWNSIANSMNKLICDLTFQPHIFGFHLKDKNFISSVQSRITNLVGIVKSKASSNMSKSLTEALATEFKMHYENLVENAEQQLHLNAVTTKHQSLIEALKMIVKSMKSFGFSADILSYVEGTITKLIVDLFNGIVEQRQMGFFARNILPDIKEYGNNIMKMALSVRDVTKELAALLVNESELNQSGAFGTVSYGSHFMDVYRPSLYEYFLQNAETSVMRFVEKITPNNIQHICRMLIQFTQLIYKWKRYDENCLKSIVRSLLNVWTRIEEISSQDAYNQSTCLSMIDLMIHTALICPFPLHEISMRTSSLQPWILQLLNDPNKSLELKTRVISLVPCIIEQSQNERPDIQKALENIQLKHFPLHSNEFPVGSLERSGYVNALESILKAMVASQSVVLLTFIIRLTAADPKHILEYSIQEHLELFLRKQSAIQQRNCLDIPFQLFCDTSLEPTIRLSIMKRFLLRMIKQSYVESLLLFYAAHIKQIDNMLRTNYGLGSSGWEVERALTNRIGAFQLVEALMGSIPKEKLFDKTNPILLAYMGADKELNGRELVVELTKKAQSTRSDIFVTDDATAKELFRKYQCASFNAMCAILCNTQTKLEFYERLLFKESPEKNNYIWRNIVDQSSDLYTSTFTQEYEDFPKIKERFVSIRRVDGESDEVQKRYIKSQSVFDSSLSQDVTKLDLSSSSIRSDAEVAALEPIPATLTVKFEKSAITDHESMAVLCAVYAHMLEQKITPISENPLARRKTPDWVDRIANIVGDSRQHKNIRLFLVKSVEICRPVFRHYAHAMTRPVLQLLVDECAGSQMSSFVMDLIVMLLEWKNDYQISSFEEIGLVSSLLEFLMKNSWNPRKEIFKQNLEIIKNVVENWRDVLSLKKQFLFDSINRTSDNFHDNICGLQINAIVLANNLIPWTDMSRDAYLQCLIRYLSGDSTAVFQPAAQIIGMCLAIIKPDEDNAFIQELNALLTKLKERNKVKEFIDILYGVHKSYPRVVDNFFMAIGNHISILSGAPKRICLEMFLSRMEFYESGICREIQAIGVKKLMKGKEYQLLALHIMNKALPKMSLNDISSFMDDICEFVDSNVVECRDVMYEMLMFICENFPDSDLSKRSSSILLNGLIDSDSDIQTRIFNFWSHPARLPNTFDNRFLYLFEKLFDEQSEKHFLSYCTQLLLEPAILNPDSKRQVFEHQSDHENKLNEYDIDVSWKTQNSLIKAPLFVQTHQETVFSDDLLSTQRMIRQTNSNLAFEPTRDPQTMSQTSDTFSLQSASSFLFSQQPTTLDRRSRRVNANVQSKTNDSKVYASLRRRIVADKDKTSRAHALAAIERNSYSTAVQSEAMQRKEHHVQLYRRYRYGDYPDLLINSLALLLPLKGLVKRDKVLARQLLVSIFTGVVKELGAIVGLEFTSAVGQSMQSIFVKTKNHEPVVFGALMEIALTNPKVFNLPIDIVTMLSMANNMMSIGIQYIENRLHFNSEASESRSEKLSNCSVDSEEDRWLKLAKMYRDLSEHDIVAGIFADKLNVDDKITRAIELEQNNDFSDAQKIYLEVILRQNKLELDFGYEAYYKCFEYLSDWSSLSLTLKQQYESYDELWADEWNFENILPLVIKSELRMILNGHTENRQEFLNELKKWLLMSDRGDYIKINFGEELMMFHVANSDYLSARVHSEQNLTAFISDWCTLNNMSHKIRCKKLLNVRNVAEIHKYSKLLTNADTEAKEIDIFCQLWKHSHPQSFDSILLWDAMTTYRMFAGEILKFTATEESVKDNITESITSCLFKMLDLSLTQNNLKLSDTIFDKFVHYCSESNDQLALDLHLARSKQHLLKAKKESLPQSKLELYCNAWIELDANVTKSPSIVDHADKRISALRLVSDLSMRLGDLISINDILNDSLETILRNDSIGNPRANKAERLHKHSYLCLEKCIEIATENYSQNKDPNAVKLLGECYFQLAAYMQNYNDSSSSYINNADELTIKSLLRSMCHGSKEARQYFPRLLQIETLKNKETQKLFNDESAQVPGWMFLGWISQIISEVRFDRECFIDELILRLAQTFPTAIIYPFKLSYSQYINNSFEIVNDRPLIARINDIIQNRVIDNFVRGLLAVCVPYKMLYYHLCSLQNEFQLLTENQFHKKVKNILETVFPSDRGHYGIEFDKLDAFHDGVQNLRTMSIVHDRQQIFSELKKMVAQLKNVQAENFELARYSPWLTKFQWCGEENYLELPGQYSGDTCPIPSDHIKIVKFDERIQIFTSLRMPIKIKIYCSNGKTYSFLVKYGEDMRQDERIQQIFHHMSGLLKLDEKCRNHQLKIKGYQVVPISTFCGILSFVEHTTSMFEFVKNGLIRKEGNANKMEECRQEFLKFLKVHSIGERDQHNIHLYGRSILNYSRMQVINNFRNLEYKMPDDIIKFALIDLSVSPESFFLLRTNFITSLATMNIAHWTLGIGDRHLSNILINQKNAEMLGIDFNLAFGAGTRDSPIPELIPFRLSPHFVNVMSPLGTTGLITKTMVHTLRTFKSSKKLLTSYMESFVKEPTIDWLYSAKSRNPNDSVSSSDSDWEPAMRIKIAERKLSGANPKDIFAEELSTGHIRNFPNYMAAYMDLLKGHPQHNIRTRFPRKDLSVEEQVQCLIDLAADPALLGIQFYGFQPWI
ncbi:DNA-dependent protein kinase catalytic subunit [Pseudolycoriella hygida]|uniref:non-specific serine/threonine protein kinase n=1 Tax=Pseudolycoriella hygida TaxID=35572 RepID=A0A9Q0NG65_9DIPT|nr:DNA-dependent protein kinase catalytic subunit [Pseudolycoriella hygida]